MELACSYWGMEDGLVGVLDMVRSWNQSETN